MEVDVRPALPGDKPVIRRLLQLYFHDASEFTGGDVDAHGEYHYRYLDHYWAPDQQSERFPFLLIVDGQVAGFAFVRIVDGTNTMAEFFVLRKYRRQAVGRTAAHELFARFPGPWEVTELPLNLPAQAFWRRIIAAFTGDLYTEHQEPGRVFQRFTSPPRA